MNQVSGFYRPKASNAARSFSLKENNMKGIIDRLLCVRDITAVKYLLGRKGILCGNCRLQFSPITEQEKKLLDDIGDLDFIYQKVISTFLWLFLWQ